MTHSLNPRHPRPAPAPAAGSAPADTPSPDPVWPPEPVRRPLRLRPLAAAAQLALVAVLIGDILLSKAVWDRLSLVNDAFAHPGTVSITDVRAADDSVHSAGVAYLIASLAAAVLFIVWFYRAYLSAERRNEDVLRYGRGWAIGGWLVPILSLWRPFQMTTDVLCASELPTGARVWDRHSSKLLGFWWAFFVLSLVSVRFYSLGAGDTLNDFRLTARLELVSGGLLLVAGVLAIIVVARITTANDRWLSAKAD